MGVMVGKRSNFKRVERDFYPTPYEAVEPLLSHLPKGQRFVEPCAGDGALIDHLVSVGHHCIHAYDIKPKRQDIEKRDVLKTAFPIRVPQYIITNPPWDRKILHPMIEIFSKELPTWLLFDADWMHTKQSSDYMKYCKKIVSVGRVKWIPDSKMTGKDNCAWYLFGDKRCKTVFYGR